MTPIDTAFLAMENASEDDNLRLKFYERLMDGELFLLLESEATPTSVRPDLFEVEDQTFALVFDSAERLAEFSQSIVPYIALSGRNIIDMIKGQGIGLGVNLAVAPSSTLLPVEVVEWMVSMVSKAQETQAKPSEVFAPTAIPEQILIALDTKLASMAGLADVAYLADIKYEDETRANALAFVNVQSGAQDAIADAIAETIAFSGIEAASLDVLFLKSSDAICASLAKQGLRFDLPKADVPTGPSAPGKDPENPPKLV